MTDGRTSFGNPHAALVAALGTDVTVQRGSNAAVTVRAVVRNEQQQAGQYSRFASRKTLVDFLRATWIPLKGDKVTVDGSTREVEAIDADDGIVTTVVLHG